MTQSFLLQFLQKHITVSGIINVIVQYSHCMSTIGSFTVCLSSCHLFLPRNLGWNVSEKYCTLSVALSKHSTFSAQTAWHDNSVIVFKSICWSNSILVAYELHISNESLLRTWALKEKGQMITDEKIICFLLEKLYWCFTSGCCYWPSSQRSVHWESIWSHPPQCVREAAAPRPLWSSACGRNSLRSARPRHEKCSGSYIHWPPESDPLPTKRETERHSKWDQMKHNNAWHNSAGPTHHRNLFERAAS